MPKISGLPAASTLELTDEAAFNQAGVTRRGTVSQLPAAIEGSIDHTAIVNIGVNTHTAIDGHLANVSNPHVVTKTQVGLGNVEDLKVNLTATTAPTFSDDDTQGYAAGSRWINTTTDRIYACVDATAAAAIWSWINSVAQGHLTVTAGANSSQTYSPYATDAVGTTASGLFSFELPPDFGTLDTADVHVIPAATGTTLDIDIIVNWAGDGELYNANSSADTTSTYDFVQDTVFEFDITSLLTSVGAHDIVGVEFKHNTIGQTAYYVVLHVAYNRA